MILLSYGKREVCLLPATVLFLKNGRKSYETVSYTSKHSTLSENHSGQLERNFSQEPYSAVSVISSCFPSCTVWDMQSWFIRSSAWFWPDSLSAPDIISASVPNPLL